VLTARTVNRSLSVHKVVLDETDDVGRGAELFRTLRSSLTGPPKWFHRFRSKTGCFTQLGLEGAARILVTVGSTPSRSVSKRIDMTSTIFWLEHHFQISRVQGETQIDAPKIRSGRFRFIPVVEITGKIGAWRCVLTGAHLTSKMAQNERFARFCMVRVQTG
jgi:hypothetical protein